MISSPPCVNPLEECNDMHIAGKGKYVGDVCVHLAADKMPIGKPPSLPLFPPFHAFNAFRSTLLKEPGNRRLLGLTGEGRMSDLEHLM